MKFAERTRDDIGRINKLHVISARPRASGLSYRPNRDIFPVVFARAGHLSSIAITGKQRRTQETNSRKRPDASTCIQKIVQCIDVEVKARRGKFQLKATASYRISRCLAGILTAWTKFVRLGLRMELRLFVDFQEISPQAPRPWTSSSTSSSLSR